MSNQPGPVHWHNTASSASVPCFWNYSASTPAPAPADLPRLAGSTGGKAVFATASAGAVYFSGYFTSAGVQHPCYWPASGAYVDLAAALPAGNQGGSATGVIFQ